MREQSVAELKAKEMLLVRVIRDAKQRGDDRWRNAPAGKRSAADQLAEIRRRLTVISAAEAEGLPAPESEREGRPNG